MKAQKTPPNSPYGKVVILTGPATNVECWNFTAAGSTHTLPTGTRLVLEHVYDSDSTTCMLVDEAGHRPGILLKREDGTKQVGYRFIINNADLNRLSDAKLPKKAYDVVGAMMAYESGDLNKKETLRLFKHLKSEGLLSKLQGHYGRASRELGII